MESEDLTPIFLEKEKGVRPQRSTLKADNNLCDDAALDTCRGMKHVEKRSLKVEDSIHGDAYKDIARIHWTERGAKRNRIGSIVAIRVDDGPRHLFSLRGLGDEDVGKIRFDFIGCQMLGLKVGTTRNFTIEEASPWQKLRWALHATDPVARIATWIALWSGVLAIIGLLLGLWPMIKDLKGTEKSRSSPVQNTDSLR